jgi:hypothetical protein
MFGYFFVFFSTGNQFALCADVVPPKLRSTINGLNGVMINLGGITGNTLISSLIHTNIGMISISITVVLAIWLAGTTFWILPYFYYKREKVSEGAAVEISIIEKILSDPSLIEEERDYYQQLKQTIWETQTEEFKKFRNITPEDLVKSIKEAYPSVLDKYPEGYDPRDKYDFNKTIEFANLKQRVFDYFSKQVEEYY